MNRLIMLSVTVFLIAFLAVGCGSKVQVQDKQNLNPSVNDNTADVVSQQPTTAVISDAETEQLSADIQDLDDIDAELDLSDIDSLDDDLALIS